MSNLTLEALWRLCRQERASPADRQGNAMQYIRNQQPLLPTPAYQPLWRLRATWAACLLLLFPGAGMAAPAATTTARVVRVVDGDTVVVTDLQVANYIDSMNVRVRLHGIDAPECGMPFGPEAQQFLEHLTLGKSVLLVSEGQDRYRRTVATLSVGGQDVGLAMLEAGLAWRDGRYDRPRRRGGSTRYADAQRTASATGVGLWATAATPPWTWRHEQPRSEPKSRCDGDEALRRGALARTAHPSYLPPYIFMGNWK
jgi:endonuclease YncB( thermonuclease family)